jgi:oxygen-independent coproporphyrinogen-3 oxidase
MRQLGDHTIPNGEPPEDSVALLRSLPRAKIDSLYIHVPFCFHKCSYCDFYSVVGGPDLHRRFVSRLCEEMRLTAEFVRNPIRTVFAGGGTPTILGDALWRELIAALRQSCDFTQLEEFTVEANPETVDGPLLGVLAEGGVNRLSMGAQSFKPAHLATLDRWHKPESVARAVETARGAGITNVSLDLIFAIPGESLTDWDNDLTEALALDPDHLSCYALTWEADTPLGRKRAENLLAPIDEALEASMYEHAIDRLTRAGFEHYEISNFARPRRRCIHNMVCWTNGNWLGLGPAAASHVAGTRWVNTPDVARYVEPREGVPIEEVECLDPDASFGEQLMLALRLVEGVPREWLDPRLDTRRRNVVQRHIEQGLLELTPTHLRLTRRGLLLATVVERDLL